MLEEILNSYRKGDLTEEEAEEKILKTFYSEGESFLLDLHREKRLGFPEVVYGEGKKLDELLEIVNKYLKEKDITFISDLNQEKISKLEKEFSNYIIRRKGKLMVIKKESYSPKDLGTVGIITGGTSDIPYAKEGSLLLEELGVKTITSHDSGVSGIHRSLLSVKKMKDADIIMVFAGMEGVLPTLIGSITEKPIIAVPTPIGYGHGGKGEGALTTMLQSCVPGILVVNIGNVIGATAGAIRILKIKED